MQIQSTVKQHAVPQNIMQVEFKVIGDLTMRQFFYLVVAALFAFAMYKTGLPSLIRLPLTLLIAGAGVAIAFLPIEERGLDQWVVSFFNSVYSPTQRIWKKETEIPSYFLYQNTNIIKAEMLAMAPTASRRKLEQYLERESTSRPLDRLDRMEAEEQAYLKRITDSLYESRATEITEVAPTTTITTASAEPASPQVTLTPAPVAAPAPIPAPTPAPSAKETQLWDSSDEEATPAKQASTTQQTQQMPQVTPIKPAIETAQPKTPPPAMAPKPRVTPAAVVQKPRLPSYETLPPITPDRLSGRKFTHLSASQGQIILPVRGERNIQTTDEVVEADLQEKAKELASFVERIKAEQSRITKTPQAVFEPEPKQQETLSSKPAQPARQVPEAAPFVPAPRAEPEPPKIAPASLDDKQKVMVTMKQENEKLAQEIQKLKQDVLKSAKTEEQKARMTEQAQKLQAEKAAADKEMAILKQKLEDLQKELAEKAKEPPKVIVQKVVEKEYTPVVPVASAKPQQSPVQKPNQQPTGAAAVSVAPPRPQATPPITTIPNIINGVVRDASGKLVESAVIIIKDGRGDTVRALKTNKLGQFAITTPVSNGKYIIEASKEGAGLKFDVFSQEVKGEVLPPIEITGKL